MITATSEQATWVRMATDKVPGPVMLAFGTVLANCGEVFCRYEIVPFFKE